MRIKEKNENGNDLKQKQIPALNNTKGRPVHERSHYTFKTRSTPENCDPRAVPVRLIPGIDGPDDDGIRRSRIPAPRRTFAIPRLHAGTGQHRLHHLLGGTDQVHSRQPAVRPSHNSIGVVDRPALHHQHPAVLHFHREPVLAVGNP